MPKALCLQETFQSFNFHLYAYLHAEINKRLSSVSIYDENMTSKWEE